MSNQCSGSDELPFPIGLDHKNNPSIQTRFTVLTKLTVLVWYLHTYPVDSWYGLFIPAVGLPGRPIRPSSRTALATQRIRVHRQMPL